MSVALQEQPVDLVVRLWLKPPAGAPTRTFTLNYDVIAHEIITHSVLVSVRSDWNNGVFSNQPELVGTIRYVKKSVEIDRAAGSWWCGFRSVLGLGMQHIAEGTDHLLFLLVLLLPAPLIAANGRWGAFGGVRHGVLQLLKVVTAFTVGHSITLIVGALGWLRLSSQPVETLIALSIFVSAIHAAPSLLRGSRTRNRGGIWLGAWSRVRDRAGGVRTQPLEDGALHPRLQPRHRTDAARGCRGDRALVSNIEPHASLYAVEDRRRVFRRGGGNRLDGGTRAELAQPRRLDGRRRGSSRYLGGRIARLPVIACYSLAARGTDVGDSTGTAPVGLPSVSDAMPGRTAPLNRRSAASVACAPDTRRTALA